MTVQSSIRKAIEELEKNKNELNNSDVFMSTRYRIKEILDLLNNKALKEQFDNFYSSIPEKNIISELRRSLTVNANKRALDFLKELEKDIQQGKYDGVIYSEQVEVTEKILNYQMTIDEKLFDYDTKRNTLLSYLAGTAVVFSITITVSTTVELSKVYLNLLICSWVFLMIASVLGLKIYTSIYRLRYLIQEQFSCHKDLLTDPATFIDVKGDYASFKENTAYKKTNKKKKWLMHFQPYFTYIGLFILALAIIVRVYKLEGFIIAILKKIRACLCL